MQFKAGDKAVCGVTGAKVEIQFGPFTSAAIKESYLVKWLEGPNEGRCSILWACDLEPAPKFEVGQRVTCSYSKEIFEVVAGPFPSNQQLFYVLKKEDGDHDTSYEEYMVPVVQ